MGTVTDTSWHTDLGVQPVSQRDGSVNADRNCGMAVSACVGKFNTGVTIAPRTMHDILGLLQSRPADWTGDTNEHDLQQLLKQCLGLESTLYPVTTEADAGKVIRQYVRDAGLPVIELRAFTAPHTPVGHWGLCCGADGPNGWSTANTRWMNPWGGVIVSETMATTWDWLLDNYPASGQSLLIGIDTLRNPWL